MTKKDRPEIAGFAVADAADRATIAGSDGVATLMPAVTAAAATHHGQVQAGTGHRSPGSHRSTGRLEQIRGQLAAELNRTGAGAEAGMAGWAGRGALGLILRQLPNALTVIRVLLTPVFAVLMLRTHGSHQWTAGIVFGLIALTDQVDGVLARGLKAESAFGKIADPLADKLLIGTAVVLLIWEHKLSWLALGVLVARHVLFWLMRFLLPGDGMLTPTRLGKLAAWMLYTSLGLIIVTPVGTSWAGFYFWLGAAVAMVDICWYPFRPPPQPLASAADGQAGELADDPRLEQGTLALPDGRRVAYCAVGPADGIPIIFFHGWGQSRLTMHPDLANVERLGLRLITVDRPGVGMSDPQKRRTLLDWADDVAALADHLGLGRFSVLGHSAGAPYVAACAYRLPDRVMSGAMISGIAPPSSSLLKPLLSSEFWKICLLVLLVPWLAKPLLSLGIRIGGPRAADFLDRHVARLPAADREVMADPAMKRMRVTSMLEAFRQGAEGLYEDAILLRRPWGFGLDSVRTPVRVWHGEEDSIVSIAFGRELARKLPNSRAEFRPGLGHNMLFSHWHEILAMARADSVVHS